MSTHGYHRPSLELLEARRALSTIPANTIGIAEGSVAAPGSVAQVSVPIAQRNLARNRPTTVFSLNVQPDAGSPLVPALVSARGPGGARLPLLPGAPYRPGRHGQATAYTLDGRPGPLATGVTGQGGTTGPFASRTALPGDVDGDGHVDLADLEEFATAFNTTPNNATFKPSADANQNGFIGHGDAKFLERNLTPLSPKLPLQIDVHLAPGEQVLHTSIHNSGGITRQSDITILGRTTPGAIVYLDSGLGDFSFSDQALATDAQGNFSVDLRLTDQLSNFTFLAVDPYGQQTLRSFPVLFLKD